CWNLPVRLKSPEVVDSDRIIQIKAFLYPSDPPSVAVTRHRIPVIYGISPQLSRGAHHIRRHACEYHRFQITIKIVQFRLRPDVRPVFRDIDRDVSHDPYAPFICILPESLPLSKKQVLGKHPEEKLVFMFHIKRVKSSTFP